MLAAKYGPDDGDEQSTVRFLISKGYCGCVHERTFMSCFRFCVQGRSVPCVRNRVLGRSLHDGVSVRTLVFQCFSGRDAGHPSRRPKEHCDTVEAKLKSETLMNPRKQADD